VRVHNCVSLNAKHDFQNFQPYSSLQTEYTEIVVFDGRFQAIKFKCNK
jgi:hypothetical protein